MNRLPNQMVSTTTQEIQTALNDKLDTSHNTSNTAHADILGDITTIPDADNTIIDYIDDVADSLQTLDGNVVHKTGNEEISGVKTFSSGIQLNSIDAKSGNMIKIGSDRWYHQIYLASADSQYGTSCIRANNFFIKWNGYKSFTADNNEVLTSKHLFEGQNYLQWAKTTTNNTLTYTFATSDNYAQFPSSTTSDYEVYLGTTLLTPITDYTIDTVNNSITLTTNPTANKELKLKYLQGRSIITNNHIASASSLGVVKVGTSLSIDNNGVLDVNALSGSSITNWVVNTVVNQSTYTLPSPILPSSTSSDYNVYLGAGKLSSLDFTINATNNTITLVTAPVDVLELCVQYIGQKYLNYKRSVIKDTTSTSITLQALANTEYIYGTLTSLSLTFANGGNDGDDIHIIFKSGTTATTLSVSGSNLAYESFIPGTSKYIEISAKWYIDKWLLLFHQIGA